MTQHDVAKKSAWDVRQSAQAHLRALRAERQRKRDTRKPEAEGLHDGHMDADTSTMEFDVRIPVEPTIVPEPDQEEDAKVVAFDPAPPEVDAIEQSLDIEEPASSEMPDDVPAVELVAAQEKPEASDTDDELPEPVSRHEVPLLEESELMVLPGIGPGLVWMLQRAGIHSLKDLGNADPDTLRSSLGLVGDLLDLKYWIDISRARIVH